MHVDSQIYSLDKKFGPTQLPLYYRNINFSGIDFCPCGKDCHRLYVIINSGQKMWDKKFAHENGGEKKAKKISPGKNFQLYVNVNMKHLSD